MTNDFFLEFKDNNNSMRWNPFQAKFYAFRMFILTTEIMTYCIYIIYDTTAGLPTQETEKEGDCFSESGSFVQETVQLKRMMELMGEMNHLLETKICIIIFNKCTTYKINCTILE